MPHKSQLRCQPSGWSARADPEHRAAAVLSRGSSLNLDLAEFLRGLGAQKLFTAKIAKGRPRRSRRRALALPTCNPL